jgi:hypothetical protein
VKSSGPGGERGRKRGEERDIFDNFFLFFLWNWWPEESQIIFSERPQRFFTTSCLHEVNFSFSFSVLGFQHSGVHEQVFHCLSHSSPSFYFLNQATYSKNLNTEADVRIQLFPIKPNMKGICKNIKCH